MYFQFFRERTRRIRPRSARMILAALPSRGRDNIMMKANMGFRRYRLPVKKIIKSSAAAPDATIGMADSGKNSERRLSSERKHSMGEAVFRKRSEKDRRRMWRTAKKTNLIMQKNKAVR